MMKTTREIFVSAEALSGYLGITTQRVYQLKKEGLPFDEDVGKYPLLTCARFYINFLRNHVDSATDSISKERLRLMRERAERAALENQKLRNKVIDIDGITQQVMELTQKLRDGILAIPGRVCHELVGKNEAEIRLKLDTELKQALNVIADQFEGIVEQNQQESMPHETEIEANSQKLSITSSSNSLADKVVSQRG